MHTKIKMAKVSKPPSPPSVELSVEERQLSMCHAPVHSYNSFSARQSRAQCRARESL